MDGNMDIGLLPDESDMLNLKIPGGSITPSFMGSCFLSSFLRV